MIVYARYFGVIAEKIGIKSESIDLEIDTEMNLRTYFEDKYPDISELNYKIAINQQIDDILKDENKEIEIALLPPFAGG